MNGLYWDTGKNCQRSSWTEVDVCYGKLVKTMYEAHHMYTDPYTDPWTYYTGTWEKIVRRPSWMEVGASHRKVGKTTYVAHPTYTDPYTDP